MSDIDLEALFSESPFAFAHHKAVFDESNKPIDYTFLKVNRAFEEMTGLRSEDIIGKGIREVLPSIENDAFDWIATYGDLAMNGGHMSFEQFSAPLRRFYQVHAYSHARGFFTTTFADITQRKETEQNLRHSLSLLDATLESVADALLVVNLSGEIVKWNHKFLELWSIPKEMAEAGDEHKMLDFVRGQLAHPDEFISKVRFLYDNPEKSSMDLIQLADGRHIERYSQPQVLGSEIVGRVWSFQDITARLDAEKRLQVLSDNIPDGVVYQVLMHATGERKFTYVSAGLEQILGVTITEAMASATCVYNKFLEDDLKVLLEDEERAFNTETPLMRELRVRNDSGNIRWLRLQCKPRKLPDGSILGDGIAIDITNQKAVEREKEKLHAQFLHAQKMESVGRLAGGIAHDFNNMLQVIMGNAEIAIDLVPPEGDVSEALQEIWESANRSSRLTRQLLGFARKQVVVPKSTNLNEAVEHSLQLIRRLIGDDIHLEWLPGGNTNTVFIDPSQIDQILANLCVNAKDAIRGSGRITIGTDAVQIDDDYCETCELAVPGEYAVLSVSDDGCGMDGDTLSNMFEPFFTTKDVGKGTGLGTATVYGIVKQNKGHVTVESEIGKGTTFRIYLPLDGQSCIQEASTTRESAELPNLKVLLVEDEPAILNSTKRALEGMGCSVMAHSIPHEALRMAEESERTIDLLLTDVIMPGMNGSELAKRVQLIYPNIEIIFMSGYTAEIIASHGVLDENVHYIQKPFSIDALSKTILETTVERR